MMPLFRLSFTWRVLGLAFLLALCLLFIVPSTSEAHAILLRSDPANNAVLTTAPSQVRMWFSEDLNPTFSTAFVVNATSTANTVNDVKTHVDKGDAHVSPSDSKEMDVSLKPNLPPAVYVVLWRTQSATDGHILRGSFLFTIAFPDGTIPRVNGTLPGQGAFSGGNTSTGLLDGPTLLSLIMITLVDLGVVFWVGAHLWQTFVLQLIESVNQEEDTLYQRVEQRFDQRFSLPALFVLLLANIGVLVGQAMSLTGGQWVQAFSPVLLVDLVANGHFGTYWILRTVLILLAIALAADKLSVRQGSLITKSIVPWANLLLGLALLIAVTLSGHAAAVSGNIVVYVVLADWLHLLAASLWIGGMMYIAAIYLPILKHSSLIEQTRSLLTTLPRYSPVAITGVIIMALSGPLNAAVHMSSWNQLVTTAYGRTLLVKVFLVGALLATSAVHVCIFRPRLAKNYKRYLAILNTTHPVSEERQDQFVPFSTQQVKVLEARVSRQTRRLITILQWEPLLGIGVLLCTGLLAVFAGTLSPVAPVQQQPITTAKPFRATVKTTDSVFTVNLTVSPNRFGPNVFTVNVLNKMGQSESNVGVSLYTTMLDMDMGTTAINLQPNGKGGFSASGDLSMGGNWQIRIQIRTLDNTLHETTVKLFTPL